MDFFTSADTSLLTENDTLGVENGQRIRFSICSNTKNEVFHWVKYKKTGRFGLGRGGGQEKHAENIIFGIKKEQK